MLFVKQTARFDRQFKKTLFVWNANLANPFIGLNGYPLNSILYGEEGTLQAYKQSLVSYFVLEFSSQLE